MTRQTLSASPETVMETASPELSLGKTGKPGDLFHLQSRIIVVPGSILSRIRTADSSKERADEDDMED